MSTVQVSRATSVDRLPATDRPDDDRELEPPPAGVWNIDPGHAEVGFVGRHFGLTKIRGRFTGVDGRMVIADDIASSSVEVTIDMASVTSGDQTRDDHLRSIDLFDVWNHPTAQFRSRHLDISDTGRAARVRGDLTIKGIARPVTPRRDLRGPCARPVGQ